MSPATSPWKRTPKAKVYEALSAFADGRVDVVSNGEATVASSDRAKTYTVVWDEGREAFGANDNASYWVGYMGYPIIATVMKLGLLRPQPDAAALLAGVNWNELNRAYKRDYDAAVEYVLQNIERDGGDADAVRAEADRLFEELKLLKLGRITPPGAPPKRG